MAVLKSSARSSTPTSDGLGRSLHGFDGNHSVAVAAHASCSAAGCAPSVRKTAQVPAGTSIVSRSHDPARHVSTIVSAPTRGTCTRQPSGYCAVMVTTRALVERWVEGWCDSRRMLGHREGDGWLVEVSAETRSFEYISAAPSLLELHRLVTATSAPDVWLTLVGELDRRSLEAVSALDPVTSGECMMTTRILPTEVPTGVRLEEDGQVAHARIEVGGELAARGQAAVCAADVVFDRIETLPTFRRQGLGRLVMTGLTGWAAETGATTGLLMASVSGRRLYESLGWSHVVPIVTYRGRRE